MSTCRRRGWAVSASILFAAAAPPVHAEQGGVVGWVESTRGVPVAGAVISVFGKGIQGGNLVTLSDSDGQFVLPSLPPGSYTLRAVGFGHQPSAARRITVLPDRDALFTLSLAPSGEPQPQDPGSPAAQEEARREWRWLMRHKRRSVLETAAHEAEAAGRAAPEIALVSTAPAAGELGPLAGNLELVATSSGAASMLGPAALPGGVGAVQLEGRLAEGVRWSLGGLVAESEGRAWRTGAQFLIDPGGGHQIEAGAGYGAGDTRTLPTDGRLQSERATGALFVKDRWRVGPRLTANAGARYTYVGFLPHSHHADAVVEVELQGDAHTVVRGTIATRSLAPGGDLLTLSTVAASPAITWARLDGGIRASRSWRADLGVERAVGAGFHLGARVFDESASDVLLTTFLDDAPFVRNGGRAHARGFGVSVARRFGGALDGSLSYSFGRSRGVSGGLGALPAEAADSAGFHDLVARVETMIDTTDTRVSALCRLSTGKDATGGDHAPGAAAARFDVQLKQGLPFLQPLTRADWEILLAVRNLFYEASEAVFLDELAVETPPTRVVGGISVRF